MITFIDHIQAKRMRTLMEELSRMEGVENVGPLVEVSVS
jgi:hypothetical protein